MPPTDRGGSRCPVSAAAATERAAVDPETGTLYVSTIRLLSVGLRSRRSSWEFLPTLYRHADHPQGLAGIKPLLAAVPVASLPST
jgi:hypothetical protein